MVKSWVERGRDTNCKALKQEALMTSRQSDWLGTADALLPTAFTLRYGTEQENPTIPTSIASGADRNGSSLVDVDDGSADGPQL